jgi:hypothetical protein
MRIILFLLSLCSLTVKGQTFKKDYYINYPVQASKERCFQPLNASDSMWIEELAFEDTVYACYVMKTNDSNLIVTYKEPRFDVVYVIEDNYVIKIYEIGKKHFWYIDNRRERDQELQILRH